MRNIKSSLVIPRLSVVENITFILSILLLFMQPLKNAISIFSYIDEFAVLFSFMAFAYTVIRRRSISTIEGKIIASFLLFIIVGLFGNTLSKVDRSTAAILTDVLSYGKFFMMIIGGVALFDSLKNSKWIFSIIVKLVRCLVVVGLILAILNQIIDLGMRDDIRYGMYCFSYIYDTAAIFSWYCYMFILVLSIDLLNGVNRKRIIFVLLNMCLWLFTGRSRGFAFCAIYIMLVLLLRMYEIKQKQLKIKIGYFVMLGLLGVIVAWNQLVFYFTTTTEARSILLYVGIDLFKKYFPLGAGLATFGTAAAQKYYSPVYGMGSCRNQLFQRAVRPCISGISDDGLCGDLRSTDFFGADFQQYALRADRRCSVYRDSVLQPDENGKSVQTDLRQSLKPGKSEERKDSRQKAVSRRRV